MKRRSLLIVLLMLSALALAACGSEPEPQVQEPTPPQPIVLTTENYSEYIQVNVEMTENKYTIEDNLGDEHCNKVHFDIDAMVTQTVSKINNVSMTVAVTYYVDKGEHYEGFEETKEATLMLSAMTGMGEADIDVSAKLYELIGGPRLSPPDFTLVSAVVTQISGEITP